MSEEIRGMNKKRRHSGEQERRHWIGRKEKAASFTFCELCQCKVPLTKENSWEQHLAGIRHRRNRLGCVSIFEDIPGAGSTSCQHQHRTRDPLHRHALTQSSNSPPPHHPAGPSTLPITSQHPHYPDPHSSPLQPSLLPTTLTPAPYPTLSPTDLALLQKHALRALPHITGHAGPLFQRAAKLLDAASLTAATQWWAQALPQVQREAVHAQAQQAQAQAVQEQQQQLLLQQKRREQCAPPLQQQQQQQHHHHHHHNNQYQGPQQQQQQQQQQQGASQGVSHAQRQVPSHSAAAAHTVGGLPAVQQLQQHSISAHSGSSGQAAGSSSAPSKRTRRRSDRQMGAPPPAKAPLLRLDAAKIAVLSALVGQLPWLRDVRLAVNLLPGMSPEAAASTAMLQLLLAALQRHVNLRSVEVRMSNAALYQDLLIQRGMAGVSGPHLDAQWAKILTSLRHLVKAQPSLRTIHLATPPGVLDGSQVGELQAAIMEHPRPSHQGRLAVCMGLHPRLGKHSQIQKLPLQVLEGILNDALPLPPCALSWSLLTRMPGSSHGANTDDEDEGVPGSSDSSSEESSSEEGESDSSESSSGDEEQAIAPDVQAVASWL